MAREQCIRHSIATVAFLLVLRFQLVHSVDHPVYRDPKRPVPERVMDLISKMTLAEKIGQMTQIERVNATADSVLNYLIGKLNVQPSIVFAVSFLGSVLSGGGSAPVPQASPQTWASLADDIQDGALQTRLGIPIIYGIDAVHGHNTVYKATIFPHNVGLGSAGDPDLLRRIGEATALEVRATGLHYTFAPCIAVCRDPRWGRCYESFSEDPSMVRSMTEIITGLQGKAPVKGVPYVGGKYKVIACAKHYVGDGGTISGINEDNTIVSFERLVNTHMVPYFDAIDKGISTVMISSWNGMKMHMNKDLITDLLKGKLGFKGFVITDWEGVDRITSPAGANYTYSVLVSVNAGIDMIMVPYDYIKFIDTLTSLVQRGYISTSRIDDAVRRILTVKFISGVFENPKSDKSFQGQLGSQEHRELAREAVRKSLVLLKNGKNRPFLPLKKTATKILVAGSHANNIGNQCGGWTISWQGSSGNSTEGTTILQGIEATVSSSTEVIYEQTPDASSVKAACYNYAIVVVGEPPYAETQGDNLNLTIPTDGINTIQNVCTSVKCVVVLISGRPLVVEPYLPLMEAFVAAWLPGSEGQGISDVLFGDYDFTGKTSRTWFKNVRQLPMNYGDEKYDPLFPLGFGLSYDSSWFPSWLKYE